MPKERLVEDTKASYAWLRNVNDKLVVMVNNAEEYLGEIEQQLVTITGAVKDARAVYTKLCANLEEVRNAQHTERPQDQLPTGSNESQTADVPTERREP